MAATSSADFSANVWNARTGALITSLPHKHIVRTCDLSPGADISDIDSTSLDSTSTTVKKTSKDEKVKDSVHEHKKSQEKKKNKSSDLKLVTASQDSLVTIWSISGQNIEAQWSVVGLSATGALIPKPVRSVLWISSTIIVTVTFEGTITWWNVINENDTNNNQKTKERGDNKGPKITGDQNKDDPDVINVNKIDSAKTSVIITKKREMDLKGMTGQAMYDGKDLIISCHQTVYIINGETGEIVQQHTLDYKISAIAINRAKTQFVTGCITDSWVRIHDYKTGQLIDTLKGHHGPVHSVSYSPDDYLVASGGEDGTIRLWKMKPGPYGLWC